MNHILEIKIMNGKSLIIILGTKIIVSKTGTKKFTLTFLKNSISSNKFKISPNE